MTGTGKAAGLLALADRLTNGGPASLVVAAQILLLRWGSIAVPLDLLLSLDDLAFALIALC